MKFALEDWRLRNDIRKYKENITYLRKLINQESHKDIIQLYKTDIKKSNEEIKKIQERLKNLE